MPFSLRLNLCFSHHNKANVCDLLLGKAPSQFFPLLAIKWDTVWVIHYLLFLLHSAKVCYLYWACVASLTPAATFLGNPLHCSYGYHTDKNEFPFHSTNIYYHEPRTVLLSLLTISKTQKMKKTQTNTRISTNPLHWSKPAGPVAYSDESAQQTQQDGR